MHQVFTWATAHPVANQAYNLSHPFSSSHVGRSNLGQPVGKGSSPAFPVSTLPPVQCEFDFHNLTLNRQVLEAAVVPAVPVLAPPILTAREFESGALVAALPEYDPVEIGSYRYQRRSESRVVRRFCSWMDAEARNLASGLSREIINAP